MALGGREGVGGVQRGVQCLRQSSTDPTLKRLVGLGDIDSMSQAEVVAPIESGKCTRTSAAAPEWSLAHTLHRNEERRRADQGQREASIMVRKVVVRHRGRRGGMEAGRVEREGQRGEKERRDKEGHREKERGEGARE